MLSIFLKIYFERGEITLCIVLCDEKIPYDLIKGFLGPCSGISQIRIFCKVALICWISRKKVPTYEN